MFQRYASFSAVDAQPQLGCHRIQLHGTPRSISYMAEATDPYITASPFWDVLGTFLPDSTIRKSRTSPEKLLC